MFSDDDRLGDWIEDIIENAANAQRYADGLSFEAFSASGLVRDACERCIERIAEAAVRIGAACMASIAPDTMLHQLRGLGNRLRHEYDRIDARLLWDVIERDLPGLGAARQVVGEVPTKSKLFNDQNAKISCVNLSMRPSDNF